MTNTARWGGRTAQRAAARVKASRPPCWLCGQPINYQLPAGDPQAFTLDHVVPRSLRPDLVWEPTNWRAAHARCNSRRGNNTPDTVRRARRPSNLGPTSRPW